MDHPGDRVQFRPMRSLRVTALVLALFWLAILAVGLSPDVAVPAGTSLQIAAFILFFVVLGIYLSTSFIVVDEYGLSYRSAVSFEHYGWNDVARVEIRPGGPLTNYDVVTPGAVFTFTPFIQNHRKLLQIIVQRANLTTPLPG